MLKRLCNFSPCIEQVQRMINSLAKVKFGDFESYEVLVRTFERRVLKEASIYPQKEEEGVKRDWQRDNKFVFAQPNEDDRWHTGYLTFCTKY